MSRYVTAKDPNQDITYVIDTLAAFVQEAERSKQFVEDALVRAPRDTGLYYRCTLAGRTKSWYPDFPKLEDEVIRDGSVEWTSMHPDDATVAVISSVAWTAETGLTVEDQQEVGHEARVTVSGGVDGRTYELTATITPTVGNPRDVTLIVPVRQQ